MFDKMKALMDMQKKAQEMKRQLESTYFDAASSDGLVKINMSAAQEVVSVSITGDIRSMDKAALERSVREACLKAIKRSQEIAAQKAREITGLNLPGLFS